MSKHFEFIKTVNRSEKSEKSDFFDSWVYNFLGLKVKNEKWKNFPIVNAPNSQDGVFMDKLKDFKMYEDDVFLCGYLRSGNTMMQEMIWLIINDFDFETAKSVIRGKRFPYFDSYDITQKMRDGENYERMEDMKPPRCLKSHFPVEWLPDDLWMKKPKIIHMSRDVKDVAVSMYYYMKDFNNMNVSLEEYLEYFISDNIPFAPYREHVLNFLNIPDYPNILYLTFEWVVQNMDEAIHKVAKFLGKEISQENFELLKEHMSFDTMKKNKAANNDEFMKRLNKEAGGTGEIQGQIRTGKIGGHKNEMSLELAERFDNWMKEGYELNQGFLFKEPSK